MPIAQDSLPAASPVVAHGRAWSRRIGDVFYTPGNEDGTTQAQDYKRRFCEMAWNSTFIYIYVNTVLFTVFISLKS